LGKADIDARADIYCLGCVGYWLVTGQRVFEGENPLATVLAHVQDQPIPPSQRTELEIDDSFERVLLACLQKDPADRPRSAAGLDSMLQSAAADAAWSTQMAKDMVGSSHAQ